MKINRLKTSIWQGALSSVVALSLALSLGSCTKEPLWQGDQSNNEYMDLTLELTPPGAFTAASKAMTDDNQNAIGSAHVLVFKNNKLFDHKPGVITTANGATTSIKVTLIKSQSESELFDIMVIGNPPTDFIFKDDITKDELKVALTAAATTKWVDAPFVMYGEVLQTQIKTTTAGFNIQMLRSLARIDIGVGAYTAGATGTTGTWAGLSEVFSLTEVQVYNTCNKFAVIPNATTLNASGKVKVDAPTIPTDAGFNADAWVYSGSDIFEGKSMQSTIFLAEALKNETNGVTLVVGGSYKSGATTYYRINMCVPKANATGHDYLDILRNHLYRITITNVMGAGFTTPEEALTSDPINIIATLTPIAEGGSGDVVFDDNNSILTDVSSVLIYGNPDGVKSYDMVKVKATFEAGTSATISGPGITETQNLTSGEELKFSYVIPEGITTGSYTIKVGRLTKIIPFTVQPPVDAHFDFLPFMNVASITVEKPVPWLTLSQNITYVKSEQQSSQIVGNSAGKAYLYFDENIATTGAPRTARVLVRRNNANGTTSVILEQLNLSGMLIGMFGGAINNTVYTQQLAVEAIEEFNKRVYDDTSIGTKKTGIPWGFNGNITGVVDIVLGKVGTIKLANNTNHGITGEFTIYENYAARYCYDKNRDTDGNGKIDDAEVVWYLPAQNQLLGAVNNTALIVKLFNAGYYWGAAEANANFALSVDFRDGATSANSKNSSVNNVRCVRDIMP